MVRHGHLIAAIPKRRAGKSEGRPKNPLKCLDHSLSPPAVTHPAQCDRSVLFNESSVALIHAQQRCDAVTARGMKDDMPRSGALFYRSRRI